VVRFVAPGPTVEAHTPGMPVKYPTAVAIKPADVSLAVRTKSIELRRSASISGNTGPLGTPKTQRTPACSSAWTIASLLFMITHDVYCAFARNLQEYRSRIEDRGWQLSILDPPSSILGPNSF
jgi:hypothetical protein